MQMMQKSQKQVKELKRQNNRQPADNNSLLTFGVDGTRNSSMCNTPSKSPNSQRIHSRRVCITAAQPVVPTTRETLLNIEPMLRGRYA